MPVGERKRQPGRLLSFTNKNFFIGVGGLVIGCRHYIAFVVASPHSHPILGHAASRLQLPRTNEEDKRSLAGAYSAHFVAAHRRIWSETHPSRCEIVS